MFWVNRQKKKPARNQTKTTSERATDRAGAHTYNQQFKNQPEKDTLTIFIRCFLFCSRTQPVLLRTQIELIRSRIRSYAERNERQKESLSPGSKSRNAIVDIALENHRNVKIIIRATGSPIACDSIQTYFVCLFLFVFVAVVVVLFFSLLFPLVSFLCFCLLSYIHKHLFLGKAWDQLSGLLLYCIFRFHDILPSVAGGNVSKQANRQKYKHKKRAQECDSGGYLDLCILISLFRCLCNIVATM